MELRIFSRFLFTGPGRGTHHSCNSGPQVRRQPRPGNDYRCQFGVAGPAFEGLLGAFAAMDGATPCATLLRKRTFPNVLRGCYDTSRAYSFTIVKRERHGS